MFEGHFERIRAAVQKEYGLGTVPEWICKHTKLSGKPYSYKNHEFQLQILRDQSPEKVIRKCSQVGLTELSFREVLAILRIIDGFTAIYTMPSATDMAKVVQTRLDPIVTGSADLTYALSSSVDSAIVKQFGLSFLHLSGTFGQQQAISVPADMVVHDEVDFSNLKVLTTYESRLTHSKYKMRREFSTPTLPGRGISARFDRSRRHFNMVKCNRCSKWFLPDYYLHVRVPGYDDDLKLITNRNLHHYDWRHAALHCPHCGGIPSLQHEHRNWVLENQSENYTAAGYAVSPFDAPNIISTPFLVEKSTKYERIADFVNFNLGQPYEDATVSLTDSFLRSLFVPGSPPTGSGNFMGIDMGALCHIVVGNLQSTGELVVLHYERVTLADFERRKRELAIEYRVLVTVMDALPYTDMVMRLQISDPNLFGAIYLDMKNIVTYQVKDQRKDPEKGKLNIRQVQINRNVAFDDMVQSIIRREMVFFDRPEKDIYIAHLLDMKRQTVSDSNGELVYKWVKSEQGDDHFMHATMYLFTACKLRALTTGSAPIQHLISTFRSKTM